MSVEPKEVLVAVFLEVMLAGRHSQTVPSERPNARYWLQGEADIQVKAICKDGYMRVKAKFSGRYIQRSEESYQFVVLPPRDLDLWQSLLLHDFHHHLFHGGLHDRN
jgi:hypothetical protein